MFDIRLILILVAWRVFEWFLMMMMMIYWFSDLYVVGLDKMIGYLFFFLWLKNYRIK